MPLLLRCTRLERLDLAGNCFMDVEGEIVGGLMQLPSLASLNLSRNQSFLGMWALELSTSITELILCGQQVIPCKLSCRNLGASVRSLVALVLFRVRTKS